MKASEFTIWISSHDALFPGFRNWFETADTPQQLKDRRSGWLKRLEQFDLDRMKFASNKLFGADEKPTHFSGHADWIVRLLRPKALLNDVGPIPHLSRCQLCNGTGIVSVVFHGEQRLTPNGHPLPDNKGPAACKCTKGKWLNGRRAEHPEGIQLPWFDDRKMSLDLPSPLSASEKTAIIARLRARKTGLAIAMLKVIGQRGAALELERDRQRMLEQTERP